MRRQIRSIMALMLTVGILMGITACGQGATDDSKATLPSVDDWMESVQGTEPPGNGSETERPSRPQPNWDALYPADIDYVLTGDHMFEVGTGKNVMVFLIDRFDGRYVDMLKDARPDYLLQLEDFTYYGDNVSAYSRTYPAVGYMLTGRLQDFSPNTTGETYFEAAYQQSPLLRTLKDHGYAVNIYGHDEYAYRNARELRGLADNIVSKGDGVQAYTSQDAAIYQRLAKQGLQTSPKENTFTYLHLQGMHSPYRIGEDGTNADTTTALGAVLGCLNMVRLYVDQLKAKGLYENATIIITGDHADPIDDYEVPTRARPTALFVKRAGESHPYTESDAQVSDAQLIPSILEATLGNQNYGESYWESPVGETRTRYQYFVLNSSPAGHETMAVLEIKGDARRAESWKEVQRLSLNGWFYR